MTRVLYLYGGWPGHKPYDIAEKWALPLFTELGFDVTETNDVFALDADLTGYDLIALNWNNALLSEGLSAAQEDSLLGAVEAGTGIAAWHGAAAAFRLSLKYHLLLGGSFLEHPAGEGVKYPYDVSIVDSEHEITAGVRDFSVASEQYYMSVDPNNHVLAETRSPESTCPGSWAGRSRRRGPGPGAAAGSSTAPSGTTWTTCRTPT
ncbi:ThuA domain-containing protein [Amycolatopsis sp. NEAU-NG30]|uniref:ThuA domain-containing protein n=1 Tax=Amycolatopsis melonis TaxID=3156488 RepID=A0ABV0LUW1_9PSEU